MRKKRQTASSIAKAAVQEVKDSAKDILNTPIVEKAKETVKDAAEKAEDTVKNSNQSSKRCRQQSLICDTGSIRAGHFSGRYKKSSEERRSRKRAERNDSDLSECCSDGSLLYGRRKRQR